MSGYCSHILINRTVCPYCTAINERKWRAIRVNWNNKIYLDMRITYYFGQRKDIGTIVPNGKEKEGTN